MIYVGAQISVTQLEEHDRSHVGIINYFLLITELSAKEILYSFLLTLITLQGSAE